MSATRQVEQHYTRAEIGKLLGVSLSTIIRWERGGALKPRQLPSGAKRYPASAINKLLYEDPRQ
jgi:predicted site-specific integrase-resolvase